MASGFANPYAEPSLVGTPAAASAPTEPAVVDMLLATQGTRQYTPENSGDPSGNSPTPGQTFPLRDGQDFYTADAIS